MFTDINKRWLKSDISTGHFARRSARLSALISRATREIFIGAKNVSNRRRRQTQDTRCVLSKPFLTSCGLVASKQQIRHDCCAVHIFPILFSASMGVTWCEHFSH
jgi:hypothetical protein